MDLNTLRSLVMLLSFALFLGIIAWTFARGRRDAFDAAAELPFADGAGAAATGGPDE